MHPLGYHRNEDPRHSGLVLSHPIPGPSIPMLSFPLQAFNNNNGDNITKYRTFHMIFIFRLQR